MRIPTLLAVLLTASFPAQYGAAAAAPQRFVETPVAAFHEEEEPAPESGDSLSTPDPAPAPAHSADGSAHPPTAATPSSDCGDTPTAAECIEIEPDDGSADPFGGSAAPLDADEPLELDNAGALDGIYTCDMSYDGGKTKAQTYVSVNGKSNGDAIFIVGEVDVRPDAYFGWGIGRVARETDGITFTFAGNTSENQPFTLTGTFQEDGSVTASGAAQVMLKTTDGKKVAVKNVLSCKSIW